MKNKDKKISMAVKSVVKEHQRLVPELRSHGLKKEATEQAKELKEYKSKL